MKWVWSSNTWGWGIKKKQIKGTVFTRLSSGGTGHDIYGGPINMVRLQKVHRHRKQRRSVLPVRPDDAHESEPELSLDRGSSEPLNSREEEESFFSLPTSSSALTLATDLPKKVLETPFNILHNPDEMEVTRKLSSLNFSMAMSMDGGGYSGSIGLEQGHISIMGDLEEVLSETELCSELASATPLDLPTLNSREIGEEAMEGLECVQRRAHKRPSRRKTTRRTKKQRSLVVTPSGGPECAISPKCHRTPALSICPSSNSHSLSQNFVMLSSKEGPPPVTPSPATEAISRRVSRARSFHRSKHSKLMEEDPLFCFLSDTSVAPDMDPPTTPGSFPKPSHEMEWVEPYYEATPRNNEMEETLPNESDLTETTTDRYVVTISTSLFLMCMAANLMLASTFRGQVQNVVVC